jgi:arylsulfatase A
MKKILSQVYKGGKRDIYEGGHRVPFFVRWPGGIKQPGRGWDKIVGQVDLLATLAELLGTKLPPHAGEDSHSFAITEGRWKLILPLRKLGIELYDLTSDPAEENNVADRHPENLVCVLQQATFRAWNGSRQFQMGNVGLRW